MNQTMQLKAQTSNETHLFGKNFQNPEHIAETDAEIHFRHFILLELYYYIKT